MAGRGYTVASLLNTPRGQLVLTMVGLWVILSVLSNASSQRLAGRVESISVERAARDVSLPFTVASIVALALLVVGGWL